jgi:hypothetical protein
MFLAKPKVTDGFYLEDCEYHQVDFCGGGFPAAKLLYLRAIAAGKPLPRDSNAGSIINCQGSI